MKNLIYVLFIAAIASSCNAPSGQGNNNKTEANREKTKQFYEQVMNAHNTAAIDSFCTTDFVDHNPDPGHSGKGIEDLKKSLADMMAAFPDFKADVKFTVASGDTVVTYVTMSGTNSGPFAGMPASNKQFSMDGMDMIIIKDGKATDRYGFFDSMKMMQDLGMMGGPPAGADSSMKK
jgi:steroid delta-isomerase-like uncharacterized protein